MPTPSPEIQAFAAGFPIALLHILAAVAILIAGSAAYILLTPHKEITLIREGNAAAAVSLGGVMLGLAIPLAVSLRASTNLIEIGLWGAATVLVQLLVFRLVDMVLILPFQVQATAVPDTVRLLNAINLAGLIGSFALHEADRLVLLRFAWHVTWADLNPAHAYPLLQRMDYHVRECAPGIEQVAKGLVDYEQVLAAVGQEMKKIQSAGGAS